MTEKNNKNLHNAKVGKNDEFYTSYRDIEREMQGYREFDPDVFKGKTILLPCDDPGWSNFTKYFAQNFEHFGLKKLISTSYAPNSKGDDVSWEGRLPLIYSDDPQFDKSKEDSHGKIFILTKDTNGDNRVDIHDLDWEYLEGDGDFNSDEVTKLRDEADIIITNPPFSLFRKFLKWVLEGEKDFSIVGNMNAVTYKDVFPLFMQNKIWYGVNHTSNTGEFRVPDSYPLFGSKCRTEEDGSKYITVNGVKWFTNIEHGRRHREMRLMNKADNLRYNKRVASGKKPIYKEYDNYRAMEVSYTNAIPDDYDGVMGVPISFLDKHNPQQFEILGMDFQVKDGKIPQLVKPEWKGKMDRGYIDGKRNYSRIFIRRIR